MIKREDISKEVLSSAAMILWIVLGRTETGKMPDEDGIRSICANILNAEQERQSANNPKVAEKE